MKTAFRIYFFALCIYAALTLPALTSPFIYRCSLVFATEAGTGACLLFAASFFVLLRLKPPVATVNIILISSATTSVILAFMLLLWVTNLTHFFYKNAGTLLLFPAAAALAGFISIAIHQPSIKQHFTPPILNNIETIFTNNKK